MNETQTSQQLDGQNIIRELRDKGFESSDERLAVALGRPPQEIAAMVEGSEQPDEDAVMKARGIAEKRGIDLSLPSGDDDVRED